MFLVLGTGMMMDSLKQLGTELWQREELKMLVKTPASSAAQWWRTEGLMLSGPGALFLLIPLKVLLTSSS